MQKRIISFLKKKYLCTVCCAENNSPWAVSCYYFFDEDLHRLLIISSEKTHHGTIMLTNPAVAGTISEPTRFNPSLQGIQFLGTAKRLEDEEAIHAKTLYSTEFNHELIDQLPIWEISLDYIRLIDHSLGIFGTIEWRKGEEASINYNDPLSMPLI